MRIFRIIILSKLFFILFIAACAQERPVQDPKLIGGPCEGCEAVLDYGDRKLSSTDTLPGFGENETRLKIKGTIYKPDGKTPAVGVIVFVHHTNREGTYPTRGDEEGWARQYGYIHGWMKTGTDGTYAFYTFRPGSYSGMPAHIHPIILEPNGQYYWLGSYLFADDPNLTDKDRNPDAPRGGSNGILTKEKRDLGGSQGYYFGKKCSRP